jgi:hypothetical protein
VHILLIILGGLLTLFGGGCAILVQGDYPQIWLPPLAIGLFLVWWGVAKHQAKRENSQKGE